jgi:hypothetical protein
MKNGARSGRVAVSADGWGLVPQLGRSSRGRIDACL